MLRTGRLPLLLFGMTLLLVPGCRPKGTVALRTYEAEHLQAQGRYYYSEWDDSLPMSSTVLLGGITFLYPAGMELEWDDVENMYELRYFVDIGETIYLDHRTVRITEPVDPLVVSGDLFDDRAFLRTGVLSSSDVEQAQSRGNSGLRHGPTRQGVDYISLADAAQLIRQARMPGLTTKQRETAMDELAARNIFVHDILIVNDVAADRIDARPSVLSDLPLGYTVGSRFASEILKGRKYQFWGRLDLRRTPVVCVVYLKEI